MSIASVVTRGYGSFGTVGLVITRGYLAGAEPPPPPPPPVSVLQAFGFDAGPRFGQWFQKAYGTTSSPGSLRRPDRRETDIGRILDELVYGEEDRATLAAMEADDADEASEIVEDAVRTIEASDVQNERQAMALVQGYADAYASVLNVAQAEAWRLFMIAVTTKAREEWAAEVARRIAQDDEDLMVFAEMGL